MRWERAGCSPVSPTAPEALAAAITVRPLLTAWRESSSEAQLPHGCQRLPSLGFERGALESRIACAALGTTLLGPAASSFPLPQERDRAAAAATPAAAAGATIPDAIPSYDTAPGPAELAKPPPTPTQLGASAQSDAEALCPRSLCNVRRSMMRFTKPNVSNGRPIIMCL